MTFIWGNICLFCAQFSHQILPKPSEIDSVRFFHFVDGQAEATKIVQLVELMQVYLSCSRCWQTSPELTWKSGAFPAERFACLLLSVTSETGAHFSDGNRKFSADWLCQPCCSGQAPALFSIILVFTDAASRSGIVSSFLLSILGLGMHCAFLQSLCPTPQPGTSLLFSFESLGICFSTYSSASWSDMCSILEGPQHLAVCSSVISGQ